MMKMATMMKMEMMMIDNGDNDSDGTSRMTKSVTAVGVPQSTAQHLLFLARYWTAQSRQAAESQQEAVTGSFAESWMEALFFGQHMLFGRYGQFGHNVKPKLPFIREGGINL